MPEEYMYFALGQAFSIDPDEVATWPVQKISLYFGVLELHNQHRAAQNPLGL